MSATETLKRGDRVRIASVMYAHGFPVGTEVTWTGIVSPNGRQTLATTRTHWRGLDSRAWRTGETAWVHADEVEKVEAEAEPEPGEPGSRLVFARSLSGGGFSPGDEVLVLSADDPNSKGERSIFVTTRADVKPGDKVTWCAGVTAWASYPREFEVVDETESETSPEEKAQVSDPVDPDRLHAIKVARELFPADDADVTLAVARFLIRG